MSVFLCLISDWETLDGIRDCDHSFSKKNHTFFPQIIPETRQLKVISSFKAVANTSMNAHLPSFNSQVVFSWVSYDFAWLCEIMAILYETMAFLCEITSSSHFILTFLSERFSYIIRCAYCKGEKPSLPLFTLVLHFMTLYYYEVISFCLFYIAFEASHSVFLKIRRFQCGLKYRWMKRPIWTSPIQFALAHILLNLVQGLFTLHSLIQVCLRLSLASFTLKSVILGRTWVGSCSVRILTRNVRNVAFVHIAMI